MATAANVSAVAKGTNVNIELGDAKTLKLWAGVPADALTNHFHVLPLVEKP
jgi:hypothetical protein